MEVDYITSQSQSLLLFDMCRLCLKNKGITVICEQDELPRHIRRCTGVLVQPSDNLPQKICVSCLDIVKRAVELRKIAKKNDLNLKSLFDDEKEVEDIESSSSEPELTIEIHEGKRVPYDVYPKIQIRKDLFEVTSSQVVEESSYNCENKSVDKPSDIISNENTTQRCDSSSQEKSSPSKICKKKRLKLENDLIKSEFEFECDVCHKKYETSKKLYLHQRSHKKKITCPLDACGKCFATKGDLQKHIRTHTGEKPYECDICNKKFTQLGTMKIHKSTMHDSNSVRVEI